jgi:hypothetical protein
MAFSALFTQGVAYPVARRARRKLDAAADSHMNA